MIKANVLSMLLLFRDNCGKATTVRPKLVCTTATTMAPVHLPVNANATKHGWATVAKLVPARTPATVRSVFFNSQSPPPILPINPINPTDHFCRSILPISSTDQSYRSIRSIRSLLPINPTDQSYRSYRSYRVVGGYTGRVKSNSCLPPFRQWRLSSRWSLQMR
jgi:hypothetical protein